MTANTDTNARRFVELWEVLGNTHNQLDEETLIRTEEEIFDLKQKLKRPDVAYIMAHIDQHSAIQKALLAFLQ